MKLKRLTVLAAALAVFAAGCGRTAAEPEAGQMESGIYVTREGTVTSVTVEEYDTGIFEDDETGMRASVDEDLEAFNGPMGAVSQEGDAPEPDAAVKECTMKDGVARLEIEFKDTGAYLRYLEMYPDEEDGSLKKLDVTTVADGLSKGYLTGTGFVKANGKGEAVEASKVTRESKMYVAAVEGAALVDADGEIVYVSDNVTEVTENGVRTPEEGISYIVFK